MNEPARHFSHILDWVSAGAVIGSIAGILPPIAAVFAIIWYCIQIYESKTVQNWIRRRKERNN